MLCVRAVQPTPPVARNVLLMRLSLLPHCEFPLRSLRRRRAIITRLRLSCSYTDGHNGP